MHHIKINIIVKDWLRADWIRKDDRVFLNTQIGFGTGIRIRKSDLDISGTKTRHEINQIQNPESGIWNPKLDRIRINEEYGSPRR